MISVYFLAGLASGLSTATGPADTDEKRLIHRPYDRIIIPLTTSLAMQDTAGSDLVLNEAAQRQYVQVLVGKEISRIFICSTTGENPWMSDTVRDDLVSCVLGEARNHKGLEVLVGLKIRPPKEYEHIIREANHRLGQGAYAVVLTPPFAGDRAMDQEQLEGYFHDVLDGINGDVIIYNFPGLFGYTIDGELLEKLVENHPNVIAFKNSGPMDITHQAARSVGRLSSAERKIYVCHGNELELADALVEYGADAGVPSMAGLLTNTFKYLAELVHDYLDGRSTKPDAQALAVYSDFIKEAVDAVYPGQKNVPKCLKTAIKKLYRLGSCDQRGNILVFPDTPSDTISAPNRAKMSCYIDRQRN